MPLKENDNKSIMSANHNPKKTTGSVVEKKLHSPPKLLYEKASLLRDYPFQHGKEYEPNYKRNPPPRPSIVDPKIFPTGKDDGKGGSNVLKVYVNHVLEQSQKKHQTQEIRLQHFTDHFLQSSFDDQLNNVELNNIPLASAISIQHSLNKPNVNYAQKKFFVQFTNRLKANDGLLVYARLQNSNITDGTLKFLCSGISRNTRLKILMLHHNFITDVGLEALCIALRHHPSIHTLWVGSNRITDFGIKFLSQLVSDNTEIKELNLSNKFRKVAVSKEEEDIRPYLTYISADYFSNHLRKGSLLTSLTLSHQKLYDDGAILLFHALPYSQVRSLNLTNNFLGNKSCLVLQNVLMKNPMLEQLTLSKNLISDNGAIAIAYGLVYNHLLSLLDLSENEIDQKGLYALYRSLSFYNSTLKSLITLKNKFDDVRAESIAATRNNSVFTLGIRNSISMAMVASRSQSQDKNDAKDEGDDVYRSRSMMRSSMNPSQRELRSSLLLNPVEDSHLLDELQSINETIGSITQMSEQQSEDFSAPKLIARTLSRSSLLRAKTERSLSPDKEMNEGEVEGINTSPKTVQRPRRSFADLLVSPFASSEGGLASPMATRSLAVPGVGVYGVKPLNLASIYEETSIEESEHVGNNDPRTIKEAIATAVRIVEGKSTPDLTRGRSRSPNRASLKSLPPISNEKMEIRLEGSQPLNLSPIKDRVLRQSCDLGKITGIPQIKSYGIRPVRTSVHNAGDSGQHLLYLRVSTEADSEEARPYSLIKIGLDRMAERDRIRQERQKPKYKEVTNN